MSELTVSPKLAKNPSSLICESVLDLNLKFIFKHLHKLEVSN